MTNIGDVRVKMKSISALIATCSDPKARAKLEKQFSRLMTELKKHTPRRSSNFLGGKTIGKRANTLIQAKNRVGFFGTRTRIVRGGSMSKK